MVLLAGVLGVAAINAVGAGALLAVGMGLGLLGAIRGSSTRAYFAPLLSTLGVVMAAGIACAILLSLMGDTSVTGAQAGAIVGVPGVFLMWRTYLPRFVMTTFPDIYAKARANAMDR